MTVSHLTKPSSSRFRTDQQLRYLGLLIAGILMGLWPVWPLAWISLVPLWWIINREAGLRQSALSALVWGMGYHGTTLMWVLHLHPLMWLGIPWLGSIAIATFGYLFITLWSAGIAVTWAMAMAALQRVASLGNIGRIFVGTALWCGIEALWSLGPLYGTSLAITQSPGNLVIVHLARLSGPLTITAAIVAVNGLLACARHSRRWLVAAVGVFAIAHLVGWGLYQQPLQDSSTKSFNIGIVQGNIPSREKLTGEGIFRAYEVYLKSYRQLAIQGADAVLTPEGAIPQVSKYQTFQKAVNETGVPLWLGTFTIAPGKKYHIHQSLVSLTPNATANSQYNKTKLVPLGEYIPLQSVFGDVIDRLSPIATTMVPGKSHQQFDTPFGRAAVGICYDSAYGWIFRQQVAQGGEFMLTASNNDPYPRRMMAQHHGHDVIQAISTDRWAARSTNTGLSAVVSPHGQAHWISAPKTYDTHLETIYRRDTKTLYVRWGNWLVPLLLLISAGWVWRYQLVK
ncbi:apolipoprotein N-acyltransferase [Leptothoe spongobia TAU-MAC 1115]|uniref:Apolipoprotein N-acyltransferase n=2 Tax=Leptothoe TaxID=2651725 RepID=A0A947DE63_9CYAN|nr:apolipoprotein N-acyltransferase [Leptothoe spongobia TAU-MAC 1115]